MVTRRDSQASRKLHHWPYFVYRGDSSAGQSLSKCKWLDKANGFVPSILYKYKYKYTRKCACSLRCNAPLIRQPTCYLSVVSGQHPLVGQPTGSVNWARAPNSDEGGRLAGERGGGVMLGRWRGQDEEGTNKRTGDGGGVVFRRKAHTLTLQPARGQGPGVSVGHIEWDLCIELNPGPLPAPLPFDRSTSHRLVSGVVQRQRLHHNTVQRCFQRPAALAGRPSRQAGSDAFVGHAEGWPPAGATIARRGGG